MMAVAGWANAFARRQGPTHLCITIVLWPLAVASALMRGEPR